MSNWSTAAVIIAGIVLLAVGIYLAFGDSGKQPAKGAKKGAAPRAKGRPGAAAARPSEGDGQVVTRRSAKAKRGGKWRIATKAPAAAARPAREKFRPADEEAPAPLKRAAIIINPTKFEDLSGIRSRLNRACVALGWAAPLIFVTTEEDPGSSQARRALDQDVDVVCALGGDGTVRAVAEALSGSGRPMGLLPAGTGNLLARNLDLPLEDLDQALTIALTGRNKHVDIGWAEIDGNVANKRAFMVMAGVGFDAEIMETTSEELKDKIGWSAYVASGVKHLRDVRFRTRVTIDGGEPVVYRARTILAGNCGKLQGGLALMPDAQLDDGLLDVVALTPKSLASWAGVAANVFAKRENSTNSLDRYKGSDVTVEVDEAQRVQLDGDVVGHAVKVRMTVAPRALIVRVTA